MAPSVSISIRIVALWVLCIFMHATTMSFVAASKSSALELEAKAILESGWWSEYSTIPQVFAGGMESYAMT